MSTALSPEEQAELYARGLEDPVWFCKTFLASRFPNPIPWVHRGILAILTRQTSFLPQYGEVEKILSNFIVRVGEAEIPLFYYEGEKLKLRRAPNTLLELPRGMSKTTLAGQAYSIWNACYALRRFVVYVSESDNHARMQLNAVKAELDGNPLIQAVFGVLRPDIRSGLKWNEDMFETTTGTIMIARGRGSQVRGLNHKGNRPDELIFDDLEDKESVSTKEQREKTRSWFYSDVLPAVNRMDPEAGIVGLGTLLHPEALLQSLKNDPTFTVVSFGATDRQGELLWPENLSLAQLHALKLRYARQGLLQSYYMEYFNKYTVAETQIFKQSYFQYGLPAEGDWITAIYCDPAISDKKRADEAVIIAVSRSHDRGKLCVRKESWAKRGATPREIVDKFFELQRRYRARFTGIEGNQYQAALVHLVREEMGRKNQYFEVEKVTHTTRKIERIKGILQPRYAARYIWHEEVMPSLESQLLEFGASTEHDDWPDALAGAIALLDPTAGMVLDVDVEESEELEPMPREGMSCP